MPTLEVDLLLTPDSCHMEWAAPILTGLIALDRVGEIQLSVRTRGPRLTDGYLTTWLDFSHRESSTNGRICIDFLDSAVRYSDGALRSTDLYYKRSLTEATYSQVPESQHQKLRPYGLSLPSIGAWQTPAAGLASLKVFSRQLAESPMSVRQSFRRLLDNLRYVSFLPRLQTLKPGPSSRRKNVVLYQTRMWDPVEHNAPDAQERNDERAHFVRELKRTFGDRFVGGIMPNDYVRKTYPDVIATSDTRRDSYLELVRQSSIGVLTRGLHGSLGYRLPEFLALGCGVVSEPIPDELPSPLVDGETYASYDSLESCLSACDRLLSKPAEADRMRDAGLAYYAKYCEPEGRMRWILGDAYARLSPGGE